MNQSFCVEEESYRPPSSAEARLRQRMLGSRLQALYEPKTLEPMPEEFMAILRMADHRR